MGLRRYRLPASIAVGSAMMTAAALSIVTPKQTEPAVPASPLPQGLTEPDAPPSEPLPAEPSLPDVLPQDAPESGSTVLPFPDEPELIPTPTNEPDLPAREQPSAEVDGGAGAGPPSIEINPAEVSPHPRRFHYAFAFDARASYDDNITLAQDEKVGGTFLRFQAVLTLGLGDIEARDENYIRLDYTPSLFIYLGHSEFNTLDHLVRLEGYHRFRRLALTFSEDIQSSQSSSVENVTSSGTFINGSSVDAGGRRRLTSYATRVSASYDLSGKTSLSAGATYTATDYDALINSTTFAGTFAVDFRYDPKLTIGIVAAAGKNLVEAPSPDQTFEQLNIRGSFELTGKITATASAGVEFRQSAGGTDDHVAPVFDLGLNYAPFDGTAINITTSRQTINSSTLAGQDFSSTQFVATVRQRLLRRFSIGFSAGYQNLSYFSTINGESTTRNDNYYFVQPSLDVTITRFWSAGVYYLHRVNDSSLSSFGFEDNQFGFHTGIKF